MSHLISYDLKKDPDALCSQDLNKRMLHLLFTCPGNGQNVLIVHHFKSFSGQSSMLFIYRRHAWVLLPSLDNNVGKLIINICDKPLLIDSAPSLWTKFSNSYSLRIILSLPPFVISHPNLKTRVYGWSLLSRFPFDHQSLKIFIFTLLEVFEICPPVLSVLIHPKYTFLKYQTFFLRYLI